jgi:SAM-dependent methyltransferase
MAREQERWGDVMPATDAEMRRLRVLAATFDDNTIDHLQALGVGEGWRCLEIGAGEGSIARWLARQVGGGTVVATDINTDFLTGLDAGNVEIVRHDISADPCPGQPFNLVHARNVLLHLPDRDQVLDRLVCWLRPGGWLLVEESYMAPQMATSPVMSRFYAAIEAVLASRIGTDYRWPLTLPGPLRARGLIWTGARAYIPSGAPAGTPTDGLPPSPVQESKQLTFQQLRPALTSAGLLTPEEATAIEEALHDPTMVDFAGGLISAWGRRPPT